MQVDQSISLPTEKGTSADKRQIAIILSELLNGSSIQQTRLKFADSPVLQKLSDEDIQSMIEKHSNIVGKMEHQLDTEILRETVAKAVNSQAPERKSKQR